MSIAQQYIQKHCLYPKLIDTKVHKELSTIVVIPCFYEPEIINALESLYYCEKTVQNTEVIIVINSGENCSEDKKAFNAHSFHEIKNWIKFHHSDRLTFHVVNIADLPKKHAGVGIARKIGMDEAVRRFDEISKNGIIIGYDADCTCDKNYLKEIQNLFNVHEKATGCSIYFEHPIDTNEKYNESIIAGIIQYELYLRYYIQALRYIEFPYAFHTIGSSFAVSTEAYVKQGGMNKRKAGEDFYFLQKIIPLGNYHELNTTRVIPSPRASDRVPFGTGAAIDKWLQKNEADYFTYPMDAFLEIKVFFDKIELFYNADSKSILQIMDLLPTGIKTYIVEIEFSATLIEIKNNASSLAYFRKRFFHEFNAFQILKCLNFLTENAHKKVPIIDTSKSLLNLIGNEYNHKCNDRELLSIFRKLDKKHY
jgi:hemolysin-activating ACP:hemolysin acyltransferase